MGRARSFTVGRAIALRREHRPDGKRCYREEAEGSMEGQRMNDVTGLGVATVGALILASALYWLDPVSSLPTQRSQVAQVEQSSSISDHARGEMPSCQSRAAWKCQS